MATVSSLAPRLLVLAGLLGLAVWLARMPVPEPSRRLLIIDADAMPGEQPAPKLPQALLSDRDTWVMYLGAQRLYADKAALLAAPVDRSKKRYQRFVSLAPGLPPVQALQRLQAELRGAPGLRLDSIVPVRRLQPGVCAMQQLGDELLIASQHFGGLGLLADEATRSALAACD